MKSRWLVAWGLKAWSQRKNFGSTIRSIMAGSSRDGPARSGTAPHPTREIRKALLRHCDARTAGGLAVTDRLIVAVLEKKDDDAHQVNVERSRFNYSQHGSGSH